MSRHVILFLLLTIFYYGHCQPAVAWKGEDDGQSNYEADTAIKCLTIGQYQINHIEDITTGKRTSCTAFTRQWYASGFTLEDATMISQFEGSWHVYKMPHHTYQIELCQSSGLFSKECETLPKRWGGKADEACYGDWCSYWAVDDNIHAPSEFNECRIENRNKLARTENGTPIEPWFQISVDADGWYGISVWANSDNINFGFGDKIQFPNGHEYSVVSPILEYDTLHSILVDTRKADVMKICFLRGKETHPSCVAYSLKGFNEAVKHWLDINQKYIPAMQQDGN